MIEAWLLLPALALAYLVGRVRPLRGGAGVGAGWCVVAVAVSLSWMLYVTAQPKAGRPYVDGSHNDSVFQQVFDYNGFGRLDQPSPNAVLFKTIGLGALPSSPPGGTGSSPGPSGPTTVGCCPAVGHRARLRPGARGADDPGPTHSGPGLHAVGDLAGRARGGLQRQHHDQLLLRRRAHPGHRRPARRRGRWRVGAPPSAWGCGSAPRSVIAGHRVYARLAAAGHGRGAAWLVGPPALAVGGAATRCSSSSLGARRGAWPVGVVPRDRRGAA